MIKKSEALVKLLTVQPLIQALVSHKLSQGAIINLLKVVITFSRHVKDLPFYTAANDLVMSRHLTCLLVIILGTSTITMAK